MICPCCLQSVADGSSWWVGIPFTRSEAQMIANLEAARPNALSADQILAGVYADKNSLVVMLCRLRKKIARHGWTIANKSKRGTVGSYWLQEIA